MNDKYDYVQELNTFFLNNGIHTVKTTGCGARKIRQKAFDSFRHDKIGINPIQVCRKGAELFFNSAFKIYHTDGFPYGKSGLKSTAVHSDIKNTILEEEFTNLKSEETSLTAVMELDI